MQKLFYSLAGLILLLCGSFSASAQHPTHFRQGYYIDLDGNNHYGSIRYTYDHQAKFTFLSEETRQQTTMRPEQVKGFVVEADSFIVLRDFNFLGAVGGVHWLMIDFVQVIEPGAVSLLLHYSTQGNPGGGEYGGGTPIELRTHLLIRNSQPAVSVHVPRNYKRFKKLVGPFFNDRPELVAAIEQGKYTSGNILDLVKRYNQQEVNH